MDPKAENARMLIVEDDPDISLLVTEQLRDLGITAVAVASGEEALARAVSESFVGFVVDLTLPGIGGFEICRRLRASAIRAPIMILTSRGDTIDKVMGFDAGADDYLTKPFDVLEFSARIRALLRRSERGWTDSTSQTGPTIQFAELTLDSEGRVAKIGEVTLDLTRTEFDLLELMMKNPGKTFSREDLVQQIWGSSLDAYAENITTHVSRLRNKLIGSPDFSPVIATVRGIGYRFLKLEEWPPKT